MAKRRRPASIENPPDAQDAPTTRPQQIALPLDETAMIRMDTPDLRALNRRPTLALAAIQRSANASENGAAPRPRRVSQPKDARPSARQRVNELRTALDEGWEIVQPIFARPLWSVADDTSTAFSFVLRRQHDTRLVTVPEGRLVQRFIRDHQLTVDDRR